MSAGSRSLVALRATAFGLVAASLATLGHWAASGRTPEPALWLGFALLTGVLVLPLLRRERGWVSILVVLAVAQLGLHAAFTAGFGLDAHAHAATQASPGWPMIALHAAAVVASAWWLRRGEAALWRRLRRAAAVALAVAGRLAAGRPGARARGPELLHEPPATQVASAVRPLVDRISHRGPPPRACPCVVS